VNGFHDSSVVIKIPAFSALESLKLPLDSAPFFL
jgi:hypothetical protein